MKKEKEKKREAKGRKNMVALLWNGDAIGEREGGKRQKGRNTMRGESQRGESPQKGRQSERRSRRLESKERKKKR